MRGEIIGPADAITAAAIAAAVEQLMAEESAARAIPPGRPRQSNWVLSWRPRPVEAPVHSADPYQPREPDLGDTPA